MTGTLYLCATPIGNLEDITLRVLRVLQEVDVIAAEDTRNSIKLLNHFEIKVPMTSYHEYNKIEKSIANFDVLAYDVAPRIKFIEERKKYIVSACYWSNYKGLVCCEVPITLSEEYQVTFGEEKEIILFSNGSLISN